MLTPKSGTVLLVDDEPEIILALEYFLSRKGIEVLKASNGHEALKILSTHPRMPHLILLDGNMPVMNGQDFLKLKRHESRLNMIPVLLLTCEDLQESDPSIVGRMPKPFDVFKLIEKIDQYLLPVPLAEVSR